MGIVIHEPYAPYQFAWNWVLPFDPFPFNGSYHAPDPFNSATYYRVDVNITSSTGSQHLIPVWYNAQPNLPVWYGFWAALVASGYALVKRREVEAAVLILSGILLTFVPSLILSTVTRRLGFDYYFLYVLPFVTFGLAYAWKMLPEKYGKTVFVINIIAALAFFIWFFPVRPLS